MKKYDAQMIKKLIENEGETIESIWLGMEEDFPPTSAEIFRNGKTLIALDKKTVSIAGISGSIWATPSMEIKYKDGSKEMKPCFYDDGKTASDDEIRGARSFAQATNSLFGLLE